MSGEAKPTLTINDLALAQTGIQLAVAWFKRNGHSRYARPERAKLLALNKKLDSILNRFSPPRADDGEVPDNGDDTVTLTHVRPEA